ncbi:UNVERIFIED_CONTAM: hypothetical protein FKN15_077328 [Acipenser sinensis]
MRSERHGFQSIPMSSYSMSGANSNLKGKGSCHSLQNPIKPVPIENAEIKYDVFAKQRRRGLYQSDWDLSVLWYQNNEEGDCIKVTGTCLFSEQRRRGLYQSDWDLSVLWYQNNEEGDCIKVTGTCLFSGTRTTKKGTVSK